jgi:hypothetical protein
MEITSFKLSNDKQNLILDLTNATNATGIFLWTDKTYKYENKKLDFSNKLTGAATQNLTISLTDLDISFFDGVYFVDIVSSTESCSAITSDLTRFEECLLDKVMEMAACSSCQKVEDPQLVNIQAMLDGLNIAIKHGFVQDILENIKALDKLCGDDCRSCGSYRNVTDSKYFSFNIISKSS